MASYRKKMLDAALKKTTLESCRETVFTLICDNNRVNQSCYTKQFKPENKDSPWIVKHPSKPNHVLYLLYDPVHIIKNIRNNWLNDKKQTLFFYNVNYELKKSKVGAYESIVQT